MNISVITINFNNSAGLTNTVKSVISQTHLNFEYIIIDGGSTDTSLEVIQQYLPYIDIWVSERDNGIYHAMNKGIKYATGDYLLFLNSGDTLADPDILNSVMPELGIEDLVYGSLNIIEERRTWIKTYPDKLSFSYFITDTLPHPATFIKRKLFNQVGLYNEELKIVSDWEFFMLAVSKFNCSYKQIPYIISNFALDGISSDKAFEHVRLEEKKIVLLHNFQAFIPDYEEMGRIKDELYIIKRSKIYMLQQKLKKLLVK